MIRTGLLSCVLLTACGTDAAEEATSPPRPRGPLHGEAAPTVVLVTLDTTRQDRLGCYGSTQGASPWIDALAAKGRRFDRAWATNPITLPSHTTMLTGVWPSEHGIEDNSVFRVRPEAALVSEVLADQAVRTGAFVGSFILEGRYGLDQGFEVYDAPTPWKRGFQAVTHRPASDVIDATEEWLDDIASDEPIFLWVHFYDPHRPWMPPARLLEQFDGDAYAAEIAFCDEQLARLERLLDARERQRRLWVVTADHGESMGEHGEETHGVFLYEGPMRIPLIVAGEGIEPAVDARPASLVDLAPTFLDFVGLEPLGVGRSLLASPLDERPIYLETFLPYHSYRWHPFRGLVEGDHKLVVGKRTELYDLSDDPEESRDLAASQPERVAELRSKLDAFLSQHPARSWHSVQSAGDELERLQAMGYVTLNAGTSSDDDDLPDPHLRIGDLELADKARELIQSATVLMGLSTGTDEQQRALAGTDPDKRRAQGRTLLVQARTELKRLFERNPNDPFHDQAMAQIELALERFSAAVPFGERAVTRQPGDSMSRWYLAMGYDRTGRGDWARLEMHKALTYDPKFSRGYRWLLAHHLDRQEYGRAAWWLNAMSEHLDANASSWDDIQPMARAIEEGLRRTSQPIDEPATYPLDEPLPEGVRNQ